MKISKLPLRIEPGLVALLCAWFYFDPAGTFLPFVCAAALHEAGHLAMLLWLRQPVHSLCLGLQGAVLRTGPLRYRDELLAAAAGPAMNLALLLAFLLFVPLRVQVLFRQGEVTARLRVLFLNVPLFPTPSGKEKAGRPKPAQGRPEPHRPDAPPAPAAAKPHATSQTTASCLCDRRLPVYKTPSIFQHKHNCGPCE